ncbi:hypothetical protein A3B45_00800 [Candidatus Daviesbacteria bacterium RIFCSPLOWO2_01_FULL_39_12]|uniref:PIN domain-containing protein n=1 Tax=Candidatus Daviesbacteria bacterium RIFCSPLOWO2_01_FULL_39_12 TaxID=1797785 RepID=A0A1F5KQN8_9BACT|nr:MAG: hypothetical protein A3D79_01890 [Candidatus Daviesbacteria bacterium RIFCSPHIGHO2_02_FULL_39_8]OGE43246.1 MAG: hypothetical protein A3B45_00800 [Candidatus Daviesbacteria bacterium RIFCSPLOWO2_01_FULL_39_12]
MVVIDTNVIIDHLRQKGSSDSLLSKLLKQIELNEAAISFITIQELFAGQSTINKEIEEWILKIINPYQILPYTFEVAKLAGEIDRDSKNQIDFPDAAIAATAILNKTSLLTLNKKDFKGIKDLKLI